MANPDLHEAAERMTRLIEAVPDDAMNAPTPCPDLPLGALIDHVGGFAKVFTASAKRDRRAHGTAAGSASRQTRARLARPNRV